MLTKLSKIMTEITKFTNKHNVEVKFNLYQVKELREESDDQASNWATFEKEAGLFCIFGKDSSKLQYTGTDAKTIGTSLYKILFKNEKVKSEINDDDTVIIINMEKESYMAVSLKSYINKMGL